MSGNVRTLDEDLQALGIGGGSEAFVNDVKRRTGLLEDQATTKPAGGQPQQRKPVARKPAAEGAGGQPLDEERLEEFKWLKKAMKSAAERLKAKRAGKQYRKANKSRLARLAKVYAKKFGHKIRMKMKKLAAKMGGWAKLAKIRHAANKAGKRMSLATGIDSIANLREHLEGTQETKVSPYEEACVRAGVVALDLAVVFDVLGESTVAEGLYALSDRCADLSEQFDGVFEPSAELESQLQAVLESVSKALDAHHDIGSPTVMEAVDFAEGEEIAE